VKGPQEASERAAAGRDERKRICMAAPGFTEWRSSAASRDECLKLLRETANDGADAYLPRHARRDHAERCTRMYCSAADSRRTATVSSRLAPNVYSVSE
jgi:hypothetical protein